MVYVAGRKVKVVTGDKTQTVNVYTSESKHGKYEYILCLHPPFVSEADIRKQAFSTVEDLVTFLRVTHKAEVKLTPQPVVSGKSQRTTHSDTDRVTSIIAKVRNHPVLAFIIFVGIVVVAIGMVTDALTNILTLLVGGE